MRILIIGGTAFTGPHIARGLLSHGHDVAVFNRGKTPDELPGEIVRLQGDRLNLLDHAAELRTFAPEIVVHMVLVTAQDAWNCLEVFRGVARRIVGISSQDVYGAYGRLLRQQPGPPDPVPLGEEAPLRSRLFPYRERVKEPDDPYFHYDKILVERLLLSEPGLPGTILRYPMVYGPGDRQHRLHALLKRMDDGRPAILLDAGMAPWRWSKGYVEDMAQAVVLAVRNERAAGRIYNVAEETPPTQAEWAALVGRAAGWDGRILALPSEQMPAHLANDMDTTQDLVVDTARIRDELGYAETVDPAEALRRTIAWERAHPPAAADPQAFDYAAEDEAIGRAD